MALIPLHSGQLSIAGVATKLIGAPANAYFLFTGPVLLLHVKQPGLEGNNWKILVKKGEGANAPLTHTLDLTSKELTIQLATNGSSVATTTGNLLVTYLTTGAGNEILKHFSYTLAASGSSVVTDFSSFTNFISGAEGTVLFERMLPTQIIFTVSGNNIRYRVDGGFPQTSTGLRALANTEIRYAVPGGDYVELLRNLNMISETGTAVVDYTLFRES